MIACRRALSVALVLAAVSSEAAEGQCDASDGCASSTAGEDTISVLQVKAKPRAGNVKHLPRSGVPIVNYHLAHPSGLEPSLAERRATAWMVNMNSSTSDEGIHEFCRLARKKGATCKIEGHPTEHGVGYCSIDATEEQLDEVATTFGGVTAVEADGWIKVPVDWEETADALLQTPSTPWGLDRVDTRGDDSGMDNSYTPPTDNDGQGAHVYVVDTGIRNTHEQFGGRAFAACDFSLGSPLVCQDQNCALDTDGHGTHCAGTVAGANFGVARQASVYSVKVFGDDGGAAWSWLVGALDWVVTFGNRPSIMSMSLGGRGHVTSVANAIDAATADGVVVVVAAGNENDDACNYSPAYVPNAITVGSSNNGDTMSYFSNYDSCVDLFAPGGSVLSCGIASDTAERTLSGTSMACPHVAGAAALVLAANKDQTVAEVTAKLVNGANNGVLAPSPSIHDAPNKLLFVGDIGSAPTPPAPTPPAPTPPAPTPPAPPCLSHTGEEQ